MGAGAVGAAAAAAGAAVDTTLFFSCATGVVFLASSFLAATMA